MRTIILTALTLAGAFQPLLAGWKAGLAKTNITPREPIFMAGYGSRTHPSEGVLAELYVKALALEDEAGTRAVLVTSDLLGFPKNVAGAITSRAMSKYSLGRDRIALNSSHTHSGPVIGHMLAPAYDITAGQQVVIDRYTAWLVDRVVDTIGASLGNLTPAALTFSQETAGFAVNRRHANHRAWPGPVDHDVPVLAVRAPGGQLRAAVFGYACHATTVSVYQLSGDWPGFAQAELETDHPGAEFFFVAGAGADANPLPRHTVELARIYGKVMAAAVNAALEAKPRTVSGPLRTAFDCVNLPFLCPPTRAQLEANLSDKSVYVVRHAMLLLSAMDRDGKLADHYPYPLQVWRFGKDLTFIVMGGEVVVDYALRFKAQYGWDTTWVAGYSNDVFAYIPSLRVWKEGGYEGAGAMIPYGQPGPFHPAVEEIVAEKVDDLMRATSAAK
ncbi:MAG: neutral/alkaline non-lysosomal ceramidase N-terminal domain-containing protein [Acidobacteria bacterium]|nr:neutral/alkaline non-lysosomal ceramidase N-terminal domain-containing protein [Acidobacteriota bacterium]